MKTRDVEAPREYYYKTNHESFRAFDGITKTSPRRGRFVTHFHGADATADVQSNHSRSIYRRYSFTNAQSLRIVQMFLDRRRADSRRRGPNASTPVSVTGPQALLGRKHTPCLVGKK